MATLYVDNQGSAIRKRDRQILVVKDGQTVQEIPLEKLDQLVVMGRGVQISTALLVELMMRGVPVTLTNRSGSRHYGNIAPAVSRFGALRSKQMFAVHTPAQALELARAMIVAKLHNQRAILVASNWQAAATALLQIDNALRSVQAASTIDTLRGHEGAAAAAYFGAWRVALPPAWGFGGRAFYPPPDPVNAMLSFGYTLALNDVLSAVQMTGLDPYLGTFHVIEAGRPSLALDLLEEFRPLLIDRLVLDLIGRNLITRGQFERPAGTNDAVYLNQDGRTLLVDRYEQLLASMVMTASGERTTWRRILLLQAQAVARVFRDEQPAYIGFTPAAPGAGSPR